jgi:hypothetical protein
MKDNNNSDVKKADDDGDMGLDLESSGRGGGGEPEGLFLLLLSFLGFSAVKLRGKMRILNYLWTLFIYFILK